MPRLGISIYPDISNDVEKDLAYVDLAFKYGFKRVFTNLLSVEKTALEAIKKVNEYAQAKGMEVIVDVTPQVFKAFNASYDDLSFFKDLHVDGI